MHSFVIVSDHSDGLAVPSSGIQAPSSLLALPNCGQRQKLKDRKVSGGNSTSLKSVY